MSNETENWKKEYWDKYHPMVFRRCMDILHNTQDAEDAAQEVFAKFYEKEGRFDAREGFGGLLSKMARYMSLNQHRKDRRDFCLLFTLAANVKPGPGFRNMETGDIWYQFITREPEAFSDDEVRAIPLEVIKKLSLEAVNSAVEAVLKEADKKDRDIFYYYYRDRMTYKEIGEIVRLSIAAVYKRLVKLENKIRLKLGKDQNDGKK